MQPYHHKTVAVTSDLAWTSSILKVLAEMLKVQHAPKLLLQMTFY